MCFRTSVSDELCGSRPSTSPCLPTPISRRSSGECGLDFVELGTEADYQSITEDPSLWSPITGARLIADGLILRNMRRTFEIVEQRNVPGQTVIAAPFTAFGARIAQERLGIPLVTVCLQPSALAQHAAAAGHQAASAFARHLPRTWNQLCSVWPTASFSTRSFAARPTRCAESSGSLPSAEASPIGRFHRRGFSVSFPIGLRRRSVRLARSVRLCQFPLYDASEHDAVLHRGERVPGRGRAAAGLHAGVGHEACVQVLRRPRSKPAVCMGARGVLVSPFRDHLPRELPPYVQCIDSFPFSRLFPRAAAVVHHGGIGTTSLALEAAAPQLIMPMAFDQHDNARRLERLGVARSLSPAEIPGPPPWRGAGRAARVAVGRRGVPNC